MRLPSRDRIALGRCDDELASAWVMITLHGCDGQSDGLSRAILRAHGRGLLHGIPSNRLSLASEVSLRALRCRTQAALLWGVVAVAALVQASDGIAASE